VIALLCSVIESFEGVAAVFAQQLSLNEKQNFTTPSITLVTEMVNNKHEFMTEY
jgi:hypothetical protein